jgi:cytosine/adenosine deaminase-related metal-dependent hydrolase
VIDESTLTGSLERWLRMAQLFLYVFGLSSVLFAVISGRIVAVGSAAEIDQWRGTRTTLVDGRGKLLVPGFNDAHVHFFSEAQSWTMSI